MQNDWRLTNQMKYLHRAQLTKALFRPTISSDHEHCEFCWGKFGQDPNQLRSGYCTIDQYRWICEKCFHDFEVMFEWDIISETNND